MVAAEFWELSETARRFDERITVVRQLIGKRDIGRRVISERFNEADLDESFGLDGFGAG